MLADGPRPDRRSVRARLMETNLCLAALAVGRCARQNVAVGAAGDATMHGHDGIVIENS